MTGKNKKQFEKWYKNRPIIDGLPVTLNGFHKLEFEMQIGVLLAYYDSLGIILNINYDQLGWLINICKKENANLIHLDFNSIETRNEAYKEAFKKADKLINKN